MFARLKFMGISGLVLAVASLIDQSQVQEDRSIEGTWSLLERARFAVEVKPGSGGFAGTVVTGSLRLTTYLHRSAKDPSAIEGVSFSLRYRPKEPVSAFQIQNWQFDWGTMIESKFRVKACLDGDLAVWHGQHFLAGETQAQRIAKLVDFRTSLSDLERDFPVATEDSPRSLDLDRKIDSLDQQDVQDLARMWAWEMPSGFGGSFPVWAWPVWLHGVSVWIYGVKEDYRIVRTQARLYCFYRPLPGRDLVALAKSQGAKIRPIEVEKNRDDELMAHQIIDLAGGLSLKELKRRIERFAKAVAPFAQGQQR